MRVHEFLDDDLRETSRAVRALVAEMRAAGVLIFTGGCKAHPHATCLRVHKADFGDNGMYAWTTFSDEKGHRDIFLNTHYQDASGKYADICHEFGHVLGMGHHKKLGVDGRTGGVIHLSRPEKRALRKAY